MRSVFLFCISLFFIISCATPGGIRQSTVPSAKIEKLEFKPDKEGFYYVHVTIRNVSGEAKPFYMLIQAEDQPPQLTASGEKGEPKPISPGGVYTFQLNTLLKKEPKNISIEIMEKLPR